MNCRQTDSMHSFGQMVARNFLTLGSGELFSRAIASLALIYVARTLGVEAFGVVGLAASIVLYLGAIVDGGIESLGPREIASRPNQVNTLVPSLLIARMVVSVVLILMVYAIAIPWLPTPESQVLVAFSLTLLPVGGNTRWVHLGLEQTRVVALTRIVCEVIKVAWVLVLVQGATDIIQVPLAQCVGEALLVGLLWYFLRRQGFELPFRFSISTVQSMYRISWPLMITMLLGLSIYGFDLLLLRIFRDRSEVGYYHAAYVLIGFLGILGNTARLTLLPTLTRLNQDTESQHKLFHSTLAGMFALGFPIAVGGYLLAPKIIELVFGKEYEISAALLAILIWSFPILLFRSVFQAGLVVRGRQTSVLRLTGWTTVVSIVLNLVAIPIYGMFGAAVVTVVVECFRLLLALIYAQMEGFAFMGFDRYWRTLVATAAMGGALLVMWPSSLWLALCTGIGAYVSTLTLVGGIRFRRGELPALSI